MISIERALDWQMLIYRSISVPKETFGNANSVHYMTPRDHMRIWGYCNER